MNWFLARFDIPQERAKLPLSSKPRLELFHPKKNESSTSLLQLWSRQKNSPAVHKVTSWTTRWLQARYKWTGYKLGTSRTSSVQADPQAASYESAAPDPAPFHNASSGNKAFICWIPDSHQAYRVWIPRMDA